MKAVIAVIGHDRVGILARISGVCAENNANVIDVSQTVMEDIFTMIMLVDVAGLGCGFAAFAEKVADAGKRIGMTVHVMHEDIFNSMHRI